MRISSDVGVYVISVDKVELVLCVLRVRFSPAGLRRNDLRRVVSRPDES